MPISPDFLPQELHYIIPLAELHGTEARLSRYDPVLERHVTYGEKLKPPEIEPLRQLYLEIVARDHCKNINNWYDTLDNALCPAETSFPIYGLLCLFRQLGERGIAPFNNGAVEPKEPHRPPLDWTKLPSELRYLAGPAEVYGPYQYDERVLNFLHHQITEDEKNELRALSPLFVRDFDEIDQWIEKHPRLENGEANLVHHLRYLLYIGGEMGFWDWC